MYIIMQGKTIIHTSIESSIDTVDIKFKSIPFIKNDGMRDLGIIFQPKRKGKKYQVLPLVLRSGETLEDFDIKFDGRIMFYTIGDVLSFRMRVE